MFSMMFEIGLNSMMALSTCVNTFYDSMLTSIMMTINDPMNYNPFMVLAYLLAISAKSMNSVIFPFFS